MSRDKNGFSALKVSVLGGAGYVGLITGLGLAAIGHRVIGADIDGARIRLLRAGKSPVFEGGLEDLLKHCISAGAIEFSTSPREAIRGSDVVFIAVGTPMREDGHSDLSQIIHACEDLQDSIDRYTVIAVKSTAPVGSIQFMRGILSRTKTEGTDFDLVANPEFLREGSGMTDFFYPDRIVVGTSSERARAVLRRLYDPIIRKHVEWPEPPGRDRSAAIPLVETDEASAQMIKYAANAFLAARISFINEIAGLCEGVGADVNEVVRGLGFDPRIGTSYLSAGLGFGGPCLEKDLRALIKISMDVSYEPRVLRAVLERNTLQLQDVVAKIQQVAGTPLYQKTIGVLGLAFKAGTNDLRNSLAVRLINTLEQEGAHLRVHDPVARYEPEAAPAGVTFFEDPYDAAVDAEALVVATDWPEFIGLDFARIRSLMARPVVVDARNLLDPAALRRLGFTYVGVGVR